MTEIAVFDALRAIEPRYAAYAYRGTAPAGASDVAAASEAAYRVLAEMTQTWSSKFAAVNAKVLSSIPDAAARAAGIEAGDAAAQAILEARRDDRYDASFDYTPLNPPPGVYQKTSPGDVLFPQAWAVTVEPPGGSTGWLAHTTRAAITGLRKRGYAVIRERIGAGEFCLPDLGRP